MATVNWTLAAVNTFGDDERIVIVSWTPLTNANTDGQRFENPASSDRSIQVVGTFGAAGHLVCQGSNDGTNWATLTDPQGNSIDFTAAGIEQVMEITRYIRPLVTGGDGNTSITVTMVTKRVL